MSEASRAPFRNADRSTSWFTRLVIGFALLRPHLLVPAWVTALSGAACASGPSPAPGQMLTTMVLWSLGLTTVQLGNLHADRRGDLLNGKNMLWQQLVPAHTVARTATAMGAAVTGGAAVHFMVGHGSSHPAIGPVTSVLILATLLLGLAYSLPPVCMSHRWGWDLAANVAGYAGIAPLLGYLTMNSPTSTSAVGESGVLTETMICLALLVSAAFLWTVVLDRRGDRQVKKISWAVRWGAAASCRLAAILVLLAPALAVLAGHFGWAAGCLPAAIAALLILRRPRTRRLLTIGILLAVASAALPGLMRWPQACFPLIIWLGLSYGAYGWLRSTVESDV